VTGSFEALAFNVPAPAAAIIPAIDPVTLDGERAALSGAGAPGGTVELAAGDTVLGSTVVAPDGTWRLDTVLDPGDYNLEVRSLDASGAIVNRSPAVAVNVPDPRAAVVPTLAEPQVDGDSVTLAGTGAPGASLQLVSGEEILGTATVAEDGRWSLTPDLPPGDYALQVRTLDDAGTVLNESAALAWIAPAAPVSGTATFLGTAIAGAPVEPLPGETILRSTDAGADGAWTLERELEPGDDPRQARVTGADGTTVVSSPSLAWSICADGRALALTPPQANLDSGLTFGGTAAPGATLPIRVDDKVIGATSAGADGLWEVNDAAAESADFPLAARDVAAVDLQGAPLTVGVPSLIVAAADRRTASLGQPAVCAGAAISDGKMMKSPNR